MHSTFYLKNGRILQHYAFWPHENEVDEIVIIKIKYEFIKILSLDNMHISI